MWAFYQICFCCPGFQHTGHPVSSTVLGFFLHSASTMGAFTKLGFCCAWSLPHGGQADVVSSRLNPRNSTRYVRGVCNFLCSDLPQQQFEATDGPVLQLSIMSVTAQFYLASKGKYILKVWGRMWGQADPKEVKRREEKTEAQFWLLFFCFFFFFLLPLSLPYVNCASQESCLLHLRFSLQSSDLPLTYFCGLFPFFVF